MKTKGTVYGASLAAFLAAVLIAGGVLTVDLPDRAWARPRQKPDDTAVRRQTTPPSPAVDSSNRGPTRSGDPPAPSDGGTLPAWSPERDGVRDGEDLTVPPTQYPVRARRALRIEGKFYSKTEFARYVRREIQPRMQRRGVWKPSFIVLHNTWVPRITQRPNGFSSDNMKGLAYFYGVKRGWRAGPALFVDQKGIWVFSGLIAPGTHSPSWNKVSWGIEQLGDFDTEQYDGGTGAKIRDNALAAMALLSIAARLDSSGLKFHKEDTRTTHDDCPGKNCQKPRVTKALHNEILRWKEIWSTL